MSFNSTTFVLFFPTVVALYWALGSERRKAQNGLLLVASYLFYGWWDWRFLGLIAFSSSVDFFVGRSLGRDDLEGRSRRLLLGLSIATNLGLLGFFKYFNFFIESAGAALGAVGMNPGLTTLQIILPVGLSFYTFQTISYSVDVFRRRLEPTPDPVAFFAFVAFFPQLVAGPIERADHLLPQFLKDRHYDPVKARDGLRQALWGMAKKVLVADNLAWYVESAYGHADKHEGPALLLATALFVVQLYCDFSGYSDIAIGCARILGFDLTRNFATPLFSRSFTELFQRWHTTLNTWLRDYVFLEIELRLRRRYLARRRKLPKGQRGPASPPSWWTAANMVFVLGLSGLWHGAGWNFIAWGLVCGLFLVPELVGRRKVPPEVVAHDRPWPTATEVRQIFVVNLLLVLSTVLFRADDFSHAMEIYGRMLSSPLAMLKPTVWIWPFALAAFPLVVEWFQRRKEHALAIEGAPIWARWTVYYALFFALAMNGLGGSRDFVYFQF